MNEAYIVDEEKKVRVPGRQYGVTAPRGATPVTAIPTPPQGYDPRTIVQGGPSGAAVAPGQQLKLGATPTGTALVPAGAPRQFTPPMNAPTATVPPGYTPPPVNPQTGGYTGARAPGANATAPATAAPPAAATPTAPAAPAAAKPPGFGAAMKGVAASMLPGIAGQVMANTADLYQPSETLTAADYINLPPDELKARIEGSTNVNRGTAAEIDAARNPPSAPAAPPVKLNSQAGAGRGVVNPPVVQPLSESPSEAPGETKDQKPLGTVGYKGKTYKVFNTPEGLSYVDEQGKTREPTGGFVMGTGDGGQRFATDSEIARTLTNKDGSRWTEADNRIMAANLRDGVDPYRGTSGEASQKAAELESFLTKRALAGSRGAIQALATIEQNRNARLGAIEQNRNTAASTALQDRRAAETNKIARDKLNMEVSDRDQLQKAITAYQNAKTPEERAQAQKTIQLLQGKYPGEAPDLYDKVQTGVDPNTGAPIYELYNKRTGAKAGAQEQATPYPEGTKLKGKDGKQYVVKNGQPVPV